MKNVYNLITDAFSGLAHGEHRESDYEIDVIFTDTVIRSYEITIRSRDPAVNGDAFIHLILNGQDELLSYDDTNELFMNDNWDRFCLTFEQQLHPRIQQLFQLING